MRRKVDNAANPTSPWPFGKVLAAADAAKPGSAGTMELAAALASTGCRDIRELMAAVKWAKETFQFMFNMSRGKTEGLPADPAITRLDVCGLRAWRTTASVLAAHKRRKLCRRPGPRKYPPPRRIEDIDYEYEVFSSRRILKLAAWRAMKLRGVPWSELKAADAVNVYDGAWTGSARRTPMDGMAETVVVCHGRWYVMAVSRNGRSAWALDGDTHHSWRAGGPAHYERPATGEERACWNAIVDHAHRMLDRAGTEGRWLK